jgi:hypothetical protein
VDSSFSLRDHEGSFEALMDVDEDVEEEDSEEEEVREEEVKDDDELKIDIIYSRSFKPVRIRLVIKDIGIWKNINR